MNKTPLERCCSKLCSDSTNLVPTPLMPNCLRIMEWNANELLQLQNKIDLQAILTKKNFDISSTAETNFTNEFLKYVIYHTIHPANVARVGSAVIIRHIRL